MTTPVRVDAHWTVLAARLAEALRVSGDLHTPAWRDAVAAVPRHLLVPIAYRPDATAGQWREIDTSTPEGMRLVYSTQTLVTTLDDHNGTPVSVSSNTKPDLMVRMLEMLDFRDDHRVLEIGTGTGYNAALLAHRLGDINVASVDIDPDLISKARRRLATAGFYPTLAAADGVHGLPEHSPYDRILVTCSVPIVPWAWSEQLTHTGKILVDLKRATSAGNLVLLQRHRNRFEGRFTARWAAFTTMHHSGQTQPWRTPRSDNGITRTTAAPPRPWWSQRVVWFLAQFALPPGVTHGVRISPDTGQPAAVTLSSPDGSWAEVGLAPGDDGRRPVTEAGPTALWAAVEKAHTDWLAVGQPDWQRLGLTVTPDQQWVWLDEPDSRHRWILAHR